MKIRAAAMNLLAGMFSENTFTVELHDTPARQWLEAEHLIERHPDGPFGSRCSYYRTEAGMRLWADLTGRQ